MLPSDAPGHLATTDFLVIGGGVIGLCLALNLKRHYRDCTVTLIDQLQTALNSRVLLEQAKGVLAERHGINPGEAFTLLRNYARRNHHRLTQLAAAVVDGSTTAAELLSTSAAAPPD